MYFLQVKQIIGPVKKQRANDKDVRDGIRYIHYIHTRIIPFRG